MDLSLFQLAFSMVKGMTPDTAGVILDAVGSEERFFEMSERELQACAQMASRVFSESYRTALLEKAKKEMDFIGHYGITPCYFSGPDYPMRLLNLPDAPLLVYKKGSCDLNAKHVVSIVGTRHATSYGVGQCRDFVRSLSQEVGKDTVIVSGLAYGIDVSAHLAALEVGLPTVAVVAHGLDMVYPAQHRSVAADMVKKQGAIITEYPSGTKVHKSNFLSRNRIIAGLADCTVVVESAYKGGALVTARVAQSYGRDVFAFPGRVTDEYSQGCNELIRKNVAMICTDVSGLADVMGWEKQEPPKAIEYEIFTELNAEEKVIYDCIGSGGTVHLNDIAKTVNMPVHKLLGVLVDMEFRGIIQVIPGNRYSILKKI